jgi:hypothetical protein
VPDVVTLDFSSLTDPNGRRLQDDVVDAALGVVLSRGGAAGISDVSASDKCSWENCRQSPSPRWR